MLCNIVKSLPASRGNGGVSADSDAVRSSADSVALPFGSEGSRGQPNMKLTLSSIMSHAR